MTTTTTDRACRPERRAAYARMNPGPSRVAAMVAAIQPLLTHPEFPTGYAAALARALVVIRDTHARECTASSCWTCRAVRVGIATITAHQLATGGDLP